MSLDFYLDRDTNDLVFEKGTLRLTKSKPEVLRQRLSVVFKTFTREWFNNRTFGAIDKDFLFRHGITKQEIDAFFKSIVNSYSEVNYIESWESSINKITRCYELTYEVNTDYGTVNDFVTTERPNVEVDYTQVPPPSTLIACDYDNLINIANQLHEVWNDGYTGEKWLFLNNLLNPTGTIYTYSVIEV